MAAGRVDVAGAAQLLPISARLSADPSPATWSSLLLAVAPAPLAAAAAFAPGPANLLAAVTGIAVPAAGIAGQVTHTGLFSCRRWWCWLLPRSRCGVSGR